MTLVAGSNRKMDKSTVLQATISFLKRNKEMSAQTSQQKEVTEQWKPPYISNAEFSQLMLESLDGFLIAICKSGQVIYVSENITPVLGHTPETIMNESFFQFVHDAERNDIFAKLSQGQAQESLQARMQIFFRKSLILTRCFAIRFDFISRVFSQTSQILKVCGKKSQIL